jgi:pimeloyl-ACP methyl ester carboxylesterase
MRRTSRLTLFALLGLVTLIVFSVLLAREIETDFGKVQVRMVRFPGELGVELVGKLYVPESASAENPRPAVLALHGFQNDKETMDAFAIELSRRGFVVLALDQYGHGSSGGRLALTEEDPTLGGNAAYQYLKTLPYVDRANLGVMGHSMGAGSTLAVAEANPDHRALNPQCGIPGSPELNNVLLTQARFEEFLNFRENQPTVEGLTTNPERLEALGLSGEAAWDTTYGSIGNGSARRQTLINTVHPGVTHNRKAVAEAVTWMNLALNDGRTDDGWIPAEKQVFMWKEVLTLLALLFSLASLIPLTELLLGLPLFAAVAQPLPDTLPENRSYVASERAWRNYARLNNLIAGLTYPILTGLGGYLLAYAIPGLSMIIANGVATWFLGNALIYLLIFTIWYRRNRRKRNVTLFNMGVSFNPERLAIDWRVLGKTALLGAMLLGWLYLLVFLSQRFFGIEFRFLWPFMREFSLERFGYFWIYLPPALLFFLLNGGVFLFGQARQRQRASGAETQWVWWLKNCLAALSGLFVVWAFQYIPFFLGSAPGFELIGLPLLSGMIPLLLFVYLPEFAVLLFFLTWFYRRTGKVYLGALVIASLAVWWMVAGTAM